MEYTTKDVCKILNITRETLRHYEKRGLIHPKISKENNYRYYDDWEINYIGECKKYQSIGFSISEVNNIFSGGSLDEFVQLVEQKQGDFESKLQFYTLLVEKNKLYLRDLKAIPEHLNRYGVVEFGEYYHIPCRENFEYDLSPTVLEVSHMALKNYAFFENTVMIDQEDYMSCRDRFKWYMSIRKDLAEVLNFPTDNMIFIKKQTSIHTVIDAGERWTLGCHLFDKMHQFAQEREYEVDGPFYGFLMTRVYNSKKFCRYLDVYLPVKKV